MRRLIYFASLSFALLPARLAAQSTNGLINSFETSVDLQQFIPNNSTVSLSTNGVTAGQHSVMVVFSNVSWPNIYFPVGTGFTNGDWSNWAGLAVDVLNTNARLVPVDIRVDDNILADGVNYCQTGSYTVGSGQAGTLYMAFPQSIPPGMKAGPPVLTNPLAMSVYGVPLDWSTIVAFQIFLPQPTNQTVLFFDNLRLVPLPSLTNIADQYGQYTGSNWPGKVLQDSDFATQNISEQQWLAAHPRPTDRDTYGGWQGGPQLRASGFFRTAFVVNGRETNAATAPPNHGRWWLVDPAGQLFFSLGVEVVDYGETTPVTGRESLFSWLPATGDPLAAFSEPGTNRTANFYGMNLYRKYGTNWNAQASERVFNRLDSWGLNTLGDWSDSNLYSGHRVPYTVPCWYSTSGLATFTSAAQTMVDVFDPAFPGQLSAGISPTLSAWMNDPWCLGFFVDNELPWGGWSDDITDEYALPVGVLGYNGALPSKAAFASLMQAEYSTIAQLNAAWNTSVASWSSFSNSAVTLPTTWTPASITDMSAFLTAFADHYFSAVSNTIKQFAPNQLYLGCKFASYPIEVVDVAADYCDVLSFDIYVRSPDSNT
ncbi:MAG: beta-galactosidase [Limisphaerales bacterium]